MSSSQDLSFHRTLPSTTFEQLGQILQQMAQVLKTDALVLTEAVLLIIPTAPEQLKQFTVIVSQGFSALLVGTPIVAAEGEGALEQVSSWAGGQVGKGALEAGGAGGVLEEHYSFNTIHSTLSTRHLVNVKLTFDTEEIRHFLQHLSDLLEQNPQAQAHLSKYCQIIQPNDATLQSRFTLLLLSILVPEPNLARETATLYPHVSVCQPVEDALRQQVAHERLLNQVTTQIRQSLELPVIISTIVEQVREFLQVERLMIYQFEETLDKSQNSGDKNKEESHPMRLIPHSAQHRGCIIYEARANDSIPSVLNYKEEIYLLTDFEYWEKYRQGFTLAVADVEKVYVLSPCLLNFLRAIQVRAKFVAPVVFQEEIWGLLIAHQSTEPRLWLDSEKNLLRQIAEQLAIAIYQAELMRSLKLEKQSLEQRVIERTQDLHDALIAAQAASRAKIEFLAAMSHELRTPLTSVIGMSATLLRWPLGELNQRQRQYIQFIYDSGERLLALINDILDLSQLEAGKAVLNISEFFLTSLAESSSRTFSAKAKQQAIELSLDLKIDPAFRFQADPQRVGQILWNLLSNAIKFTPEGGHVILRIWSENSVVVLQVEDTGIGISEEHLPQLFEKFQQLETSYHRRYDGTGLGLALTKQLVELHQGRIEVESIVGIGSIFTVWLPRNHE